MKILVFYLFISHFSFSQVIDLPIVETTNKKNQKNISPIEDKDPEYFVIQNIATKTLRVYQKASCKGCFHKMVLQAPIVVGANEFGYRSVLGAFTIMSWHKFYQDGRGLYPSWYDPVFNDLPKPHAPVKEWMMKRGAFGWYTAKLKPRAFAQWMHGTRGWGADKQKYIYPVEDEKKPITWESSGCTRVDNETIAFLNHLMKKGSSVFKIYAQEEILDKNFSRYEEDSKTWSYVLTATEVRKTSPKSIFRDSVLLEGLEPKFYLEEGDYTYVSKPSKISLKNPYDVKTEDIQGVFYPDTGQLKGYKHPKKLVESGLSLPSFLFF